MKILDVMSKVYAEDEDAGALLVEMVVSDYLADLSEQYRDTFTATVGPWTLDRVQLAKRHLGRSYVAKAVDGQYPDGEELKIAGWLAGLESYLVAAANTGTVAKANEIWNLDGRSVSRNVGRDSAGKFAQAINQKPSVARNPAGLDRRDVHPQVRTYLNEEGALDQSQYTKEERDEAKFTQGQWSEAQTFINELSSKLDKKVREESDAILWVKSLEDGPLRSIRIPLKNMKDGRIPDLGSNMPNIGDMLSHVEISPSSGASRATVNRIAALNIMGADGSKAALFASLADSNKWDQLSRSLNVDPSSRDKKMTRFFNQMTLGGDILASIPGAETYGKFAQFVGANGPQAEKVLGPYVQRAAYRYRGTETTPDRDLVRMFNGAEMGRVDSLASGDFSVEDEAAAAAMLQGPRAAEKLGSRLMVTAVQRRKEGLTSDSLKMQVRSDVAAAELVQTLPQDPIIARLSEKSGSILPSQGLLINAKGKIVSQAVGFSDDHYLPFDLKNMASLRGGQYVRTRQSGGLTGEDVYTAATLGARMVTVVSPSGVFTLEMSPDFRGARSMSDKARGMYDRYLKILDAVDASQEYLQDIPAGEKAKIQQEVRSLKLGDDRTKELIQTRITDARERLQQLDATQIDSIEQRILDERYRGVPRNTLRGEDARRFADDLSEAIEEEQGNLTNRLRLNGQGYAVALNTLKQQYPYFIKSVRYQELNKFAENQGLQGIKGRTYANDRGYVAPGGIKARSTQEGFYNSAAERSFKPNSGRDSGSSESVAARPSQTAAASSSPTSSTSGSATSTPAPATGVQLRLNDKSTVLKTQRDKAALALSNEFGILPKGVKISDDSPGNMDSSADDLLKANSTPSTWVKWFVSQEAKVATSVMENEQASLALVDALTNKEVVASVLKARLVDAGGADLFASDSGDEESRFTFGGQKNIDDSVKWTVNQARIISDAILLQKPFTGSSDGKDRWQAPTADPIISEISNKDQFISYAQSNPETWGRAVKLAANAAGDDYESMTGIATKARKELKGLNEIKLVQEKIQAAIDSGRPLPTAIDISTPELASALGKPEKEITLSDIRGKSVEDLRKPILVAWQLAVTGRALEFLDGGGDVFPKDRSQRWLVKKAKSRVRVLGMNDPLSKAVQMRIAKGMPYVPKRRVTSRLATGLNRMPA